MTPEEMLREFHESKSVHCGWLPACPMVSVPEWVRDMRLALLNEEVQELREVIEAGDIVKIADALADIEYVVRGTAVVYGIPSDAVFAEVHRSNMTKVNRADQAKLIKGREYEPPRIAEILARCPDADG